MGTVGGPTIHYVRGGKLGCLLREAWPKVEPQSFAFAVYNPAAHDFDLRTIQVVGPEKITLGGRELQATRLTDQMAADAPVANVWVDAKGILLRMRTAEGLTLERAEKKAVIAKFAAELVELDRIKP